MKQFNGLGNKPVCYLGNKPPKGWHEMKQSNELLAILLKTPKMKSSYFDSVSNEYTVFEAINYKSWIQQIESHFEKKFNDRVKDSVLSVDELHKVIDNYTGISGMIIRKIAIAIHKASEKKREGL